MQVIRVLDRARAIRRNFMVVNFMAIKFATAVPLSFSKEKQTPRLRYCERESLSLLAGSMSRKNRRFVPHLSTQVIRVLDQEGGSSHPPFLQPPSIFPFLGKTNCKTNSREIYSPAVPPVGHNSWVSQILRLPTLRRVLPSERSGCDLFLTFF